MRKQFLYISIVSAFALIVACGSDNTDKSDPMHGEDPMASTPESDSMKSSSELIRAEPVDVNAVDENRDGFVYQDPMDWNVIADEAGKCPKCGMALKKVTIDEAVKNLKDNGHTVI